MVIDDNSSCKTETIVFKPNVQNINTGARGDCYYLPTLSAVPHKFTVDDHFQSSLASGEPKPYQTCVLTSSDTFIVSSLAPLDIPVPHEDCPIQHMQLYTSETMNNGYELPLWIKRYRISVPIIIGILTISITIIIISVVN